MEEIHQLVRFEQKKVQSIEFGITSFILPQDS